MTTMECGMDSERRRYAQETGRIAPRLQAIPGALVIPAQAGTYWRAPAYAQAGTYGRHCLRASGNLREGARVRASADERRGRVCYT